ncbi:hypothetical protein M0805_007558 [Coniferiporia weirii]|nr:hypothetical protein M0805_007558 [Coniferiporia weirii]
MRADELYREVCKWYALTPPVISVATLFFDAPFGRFALANDSWLQLDGIKSWIVMELVSPLTFLYTLLHAPLSHDSASTAPHLTNLRDPRTLLALLYLVHYANRALISPLRSPGRSKSHAIVPLAAVVFNTINGSLMGAYLASPACAAFLSSAHGRTLFWPALVLWAAGFAGNVLHDEVLLNLRRDAQVKAAKEDENESKSDRDGAPARPHYGIPHGYLYRFVSYPNYLCEWAEWTGFALAAAPLPALGLGLAGLTGAAPPWLFVFSEVFLMAPRAYRGHRWYRAKFEDAYPKERRAVIPFVL